jgi:hypothetical protein
MNIDSSIKPTPASRAERSSLWVETVANSFIGDLSVIILFFVMAGLVPAIHVFCPALF